MWGKLKAFGQFWYDFIVGDDWTIAVGAALALGITWILASAHWSLAWLVLLLSVLGLLWSSVWRATGHR